MKLVDQWIGELMDEMETLGVADNTLVVVMGDNGHFTKYSPQSGFTPMIFSRRQGLDHRGRSARRCVRSLARHDRS